MTGCGGHRRVDRPRRAALVAALCLILGSFTIGGVRAAADGPTTFSNAASIAIPATGSANQIGPASPYPSNITVSGMSGAVTTVTVAFNNLTHSTVNDIDAMVVAPSGENIVVLSDVGDPNTTLAFANNATLTFSDAAAGPVPDGQHRDRDLSADEQRRRRRLPGAGADAVDPDDTRRRIHRDQSERHLEAVRGRRRDR